MVFWDNFFIGLFTLMFSVWTIPVFIIIIWLGVRDIFSLSEKEKNKFLHTCKYIPNYLIAFLIFLLYLPNFFQPENYGYIMYLLLCALAFLILWGVIIIKKLNQLVKRPWKKTNIWLHFIWMALSLTTLGALFIYEYWCYLLPIFY